MSMLPSTVLSGLMLLATPVEPDTGRPLPACATGPRHIELDADERNDTPEVCIRPGLLLSFLFDAKLSHVEVEGRERFLRVEQGATLLSLLPSEALRDGERVPVTVHFQSEAAPTRATFTLVVHPSLAERQVEVARRERTLDSYRRGEHQAREEALQCLAEKARLEEEPSAPSGLAALILQNRLSERGIVARKTHEVDQHPAHPLDALSYTGFRAVGLEGRGLVALDVVLFNRGSTPWTPASAVLLGPEGVPALELKISPLSPLAPGKPGRLVLERDAAEHELRGAFTLKLWDAQGRDGAVLDGVSFP